MRRNALLSVSTLIAVFSLLAFTQQAETAEYPDKTIEFVLHGSPGSTADNLQRAIAHYLNEVGIVKPRIQCSNRLGGGVYG